MKRFRVNERKVGMFILFGVAALTVFSLIIMTLWNAILPAVIHVSAINFWQALGILILSKILFSGFRGRGWHHRRRQWRENMDEKWQQMTPEQREKFQKEWRSRCGPWRTQDQKPAEADVNENKPLV